MKQIERKRNELAISIYHLSCSIYHFKNKYITTGNTYIITIHFRDKKHNDLKNIAKELDKSINKAITRKPKPRINKSVGLLLNYDVEGTRQNNPNTQTPDMPHFHGCIFLQPHTVNDRSDEEIINCLTKEMESNKKIRSDIEKLWIEKFDPSSGTILRYISYSGKTENYQEITSRIPQTTFCFPYENVKCRADAIAGQFHPNDKQKQKELANIYDEMKAVKNLIVREPTTIFGQDIGSRTLNDYEELYKADHNLRGKVDIGKVTSYIRQLAA